MMAGMEAGCMGGFAGDIGARREDHQPALGGKSCRRGERRELGEHRGGREVAILVRRAAAVGRHEGHLRGPAGEMIGDEPVGLRTRLEQLDRVDRQDGVEVRADPGGFHGALQHGRGAVGKDAGPAAPGFERAQRRARVGEGVEPEIAFEQPRLERGRNRGHPREGEVKRALGQGPEVEVMAGERQRPGVFELFGAPDLRHAACLRSGFSMAAADRRVNIEKRAIGVEHDDGCHGVLPCWPRLAKHDATRKGSGRENGMTTSQGWSATWTFFDGAWHEGNVPLWGARTHAIWLGSSVFDGARVFEGVAPDLDLHCARVNESAQAMFLRPSLSVDEWVGLVRDGMKRFSADATLYVRPMYWAERAGPLALPPDPESTRFALTLYEAPMRKPDGFSITLSPFRRPTAETAPVE